MKGNANVIIGISGVRFNVVYVIHQVGERIVESNDENLPVHRTAVNQCDRAQLSAMRIKQRTHDE